MDVATLTAFLLEGSTAPVITNLADLEKVVKSLGYHGVNKGSIWTPDQVLQNGKGHCWEVSELLCQYLGQLGYPCKILFMEDKDATITHSMVVFYKDKKLFVFDGTMNVMFGISGPYPSISAVKALYKTKEPTLRTFKLSDFGHSYHGGMSEVQYYEMMNKWKSV